uniref:Uncharacterized protein n=1 Tax=Parascaris univalens TaxID=6257 RepID=A0A915CCV4_PARUN
MVHGERHGGLKRVMYLKRSSRVTKVLQRKSVAIPSIPLE